MFRFEKEIYLYFLLLLPVMYLIFYYLRSRRKKLLEKYGENKLVRMLMSDYSKYKPWLRFTIAMLIFASIILTLANPQIGSKLSEYKRKGIDVIIALDISNSMLAEDIKPNRLERAKQTISKLIDKMQSDRIGLIVFAGDAFVQLPLTTDYSAAKLFLSVVEPDLIPKQGTAIGQAIDIAVNQFKTDDKVKKTLLIITDGENHEDNAVSMAEEAAAKGFTVFTIGMGSTNGAPVPLIRNGRRVGFIKDANGSVVTSRLNPELLQQIASAGGGDFIMAGNNEANLSSLINKLAGMDKTEYSSQLFTDYDDKFQYLAALALFLLFIDFFISNRSNRFVGRINKFVETRSLSSK
jgi:Ca-activated chloride channel family protein